MWFSSCIHCHAEVGLIDQEPPGAPTRRASCCPPSPRPQTQQAEQNYPPVLKFEMSETTKLFFFSLPNTRIVLKELVFRLQAVTLPYTCTNFV